jgi:hypothetical protein
MLWNWAIVVSRREPQVFFCYDSNSASAWMWPQRSQKRNDNPTKLFSVQCYCRRMNWAFEVRRRAYNWVKQGLVPRHGGFHQQKACGIGQNGVMTDDMANFCYCPGQFVTGLELATDWTCSGSIPTTKTAKKSGRCRAVVSRTLEFPMDIEIYRYIQILGQLYDVLSKKLVKSRWRWLNLHRRTDPDAVLYCI